MMAQRAYQLLVLGAGSGGMAAASRAASYGARTAIVESSAVGGTCMNLGCVPKKIMWNAAQAAGFLHSSASGYAFDIPKWSFNWPTFVERRDAYIKRLSTNKESAFEREGVDLIRGHASFVTPNCVLVNDQKYHADNVLITTGGHPVVPEIPGASLGITSDGFFDLKEQPRRVAIVGAGYIAVELAGVLRELGSEVDLFIRKDHVLRHFDPVIYETVDDEMLKMGIQVHRQSNVAQIQRASDQSLTLTMRDHQEYKGYDCLLWAIGRNPNTSKIGLEDIGVRLTSRGHIQVDEYQNTSVPNVFALGDVCGRVELTPVAVSAGRKLADRLFGPAELKHSKQDYENVPSVIFSHPPAASVGLSEPDAVARFGRSNVSIYETKFINMFHALSEHKTRTAMKLVCVGAEELVIGVHMVGIGVDEMLQGFSVAVKMGATKRQFDDVVAIHPTASEELVTLKPAQRRAAL